jgi:hypothetical protein
MARHSMLLHPEEDALIAAQTALVEGAVQAYTKLQDDLIAARKDQGMQA